MRTRGNHGHDDGREDSCIGITEVFDRNRICTVDDRTEALLDVPVD
jgi:hypothetical protein